jgi:predicted RNA-binding protein with PIN domain
LYRVRGLNHRYDTTICSNSGFSKVLSVDTAYHEVLWSTGDTTHQITVSSAGLYWVKSLSPCCGIVQDSILIRLENPNAYTFSFGTDTALCKPFELELSPGIQSQEYTWSTGDSLPQLAVSDTGVYWLSCKTICGVFSDTLRIDALPEITVSLGRDTMLCKGQTLSLSAGNYNAYEWSTGDTTQQLLVSSRGVYWVEVSALPNCRARDYIVVNFFQKQEALLPEDTTYCSGGVLRLRAGTYSRCLWSTGDTLSEIEITQSGLYDVQVKDSMQCELSDSIRVFFEERREVFLPGDTALWMWHFPYEIQVPAGLREITWEDGSVGNKREVSAPGIYRAMARDSLGCWLRDEIQVGLKQSEPVMPTLYVMGSMLDIQNLPAENRLQLYDSRGRLVWDEGNYRNNATPSLASGMYFILLEYKQYNGVSRSLRGKLMAAGE